MLGALRTRLRELYNPDIRAIAVVSLGSAFVLSLFAVNPDFGNPYYVFGVLATILAFVAALAILAYERIF